MSSSAIPRSEPVPIFDGESSSGSSATSAGPCLCAPLVLACGMLLWREVLLIALGGRVDVDAATGLVAPEGGVAAPVVVDACDADNALVPRL